MHGQPGRGNKGDRIHDQSMNEQTAEGDPRAGDVVVLYGCCVRGVVGARGWCLKFLCWDCNLLELIRTFSVSRSIVKFLGQKKIPVRLQGRWYVRGQDGWMKILVVFSSRGWSI